MPDALDAVIAHNRSNNLLVVRINTGPALTPRRSASSCYNTCSSISGGFAAFTSNLLRLRNPFSVIASLILSPLQIVSSQEIQAGVRYVSAADSDSRDNNYNTAATNGPQCVSPQRFRDRAQILYSSHYGKFQRQLAHRKHIKAVT